MRYLVRGLVVLAGATVAIPLMAVPALAVTPNVDTYFASIATESYQPEAGIGWSTSGVTLGPSPTGAKIAVIFACFNGSYCNSGVTLSSDTGSLSAYLSGGDMANTITGSTTIAGTVTSATGAFSSLAGAPASIAITVSSMDPVLQLIDVELADDPGPGFIVGSFTVS